MFFIASVWPVSTLCTNLDPYCSKHGLHVDFVEYEEEGLRKENGEEEVGFIVKADHFISIRFLSVLDSKRRHFSRRVRDIPKFITRH